MICIVITVYAYGTDKALLNSVIFESKNENDTSYIACGGVYSNNVNDNIDYGLNLQCQKFHKNQWILHDNMTLNTVRNSSGFSYYNSKYETIRGKSFLELWLTTFLPN